jgi:hypothetical protein
LKVTTDKKVAGEQGFALVLAILALMLLTFLGLTLATSTSTELQIANNYRWGQQALYNAEAGLEVARALLNQVGDGQLVLPPARLPWRPDDPVVQNSPQNGTPAPIFPASRNFEGRFCDVWGNGAGYGQVLTDPANPGSPFENVHTAFGRNLTGTFTVWVRRDYVYGLGPMAGTISDNPAGENIIVTAEGSAPFGGAFSATATGIGAFTRANRAIRRLESKVTVTEGCRPEFNSESATGGRMCEDL